MSPCVTPGVRPVRKIFCGCVIAFRNDDLPTFERPSTHQRGCAAGGRSFALSTVKETSLLRNPIYADPYECRPLSTMFTPKNAKTRIMNDKIATTESSTGRQRMRSLPCR